MRFTNLLLGALSLMIFFLYSCADPEAQAPSLPNILWITSEDMNAYLGSFGDELATTPVLDQLAAEGVRYTNAYATAPVCSPSRSCLITGVYASSLGTQHLRSELEIPESIIPFPKYLRELGYYCSNNDKEDYNFTDTSIWDESSKTAHWRNRQPGQPFFSVFNLGITHQSQIFGSDEDFQKKYGHQLESSERHDPDSMIVPPYHFDSPLVRKLWARYYDLVTLMDRQVGELLQELEEAGLTENTIVFYYADHGTGMPRSKRALYDSGLKVPLIIKAPKAYATQLGLEPGSANAELVSFVDFAPTMLSVLGIDIPEYMQGKAFLGKQKQSQEYVFGHADRVDEAYELSRTVRSKNFRYIRNFMPQLPLIQKNFYTDQSEIMQELLRLKESTAFNPAQAHMWAEQRPPEELYDVQADPHQVNNLAKMPEHQQTLLKMRKAQRDWLLDTKDTGLLPEYEMHQLSAGTTVYEAARVEEKFPVSTLLEVNDLILQEEPSLENLGRFLNHENPIVRYWAVMGFQYLGEKAWPVKGTLARYVKDPSVSVRLAASKALCGLGDCESTFITLTEALQGQDYMAVLMATRTVEELHPHLEALMPVIQRAKEKICTEMGGDWNKYYELYSCWALEETLKEMENQ